MKKAIISVTLFNFIAAGITFLINIILARLFPYEIFGRINLLLSFIAVAIVLLGYGFNNSLVIYYNKNKNEKVEVDNDLLNYISKKYLKFLIKVLPVFIISIFLLDIKYQFSIEEFIFLLTGALLPSVYRYLATIFQALGKWALYNFLNVSFNLLKGIVLIFGGGLVYFLSNENLNYETYLNLYILYTGLLIVLGGIASYSFVGFKSNETYNVKDFKKLVLSLGLTNVIIALSMRLDNVIIEQMLGLKQVAIYSAANSLALVFPLITGSIMRVLMREMSNNPNHYLNKILEIQKKYFPFLILFIIVVIFLSPFLIKLMFGEKYIESISLFQILITAYIGGMFFTPLESYFYNQKARIILIMKFAQLVLLITGSIILVNIVGLFGVAISVVLTRIFAWIFLTKLSYKYRNLNAI